MTFAEFIMPVLLLLIGQLVLVLIAVYFNGICKEDDYRLKTLSTYHKHIFDMFDVNQYEYKSKKQ